MALDILVHIILGNGLSVSHQAIAQNQYWIIMNSSQRNIFQLNHIWNSKVFIQENLFENVVCKLSAIMC